MDREKVINDLEYLISEDCTDTQFDYVDSIQDAIALLKEQETMMQCINGKCRICPHCANCDVDENGLLKEQEAVEPIRVNTNYEQHWNCGNCNAVISVQDKFCHECGKRIEWKGR